MPSNPIPDEDKKMNLDTLIDDLCESQFNSNSGAVKKWIELLIDIYKNNYRHNYSDISLKLYDKLQNILQNIKDSEAPLSKLDETDSTIGANLDALIGAFNEKIEDNPGDLNVENAFKGVKKFADHVKLEMHRYCIMYELATKRATRSPHGGMAIPVSNLSGEVNELHKDLRDLSEKFVKAQSITEQAKQMMDGLDEKLESNKISSITALTIFSAVVLTFSGVLTFESGVLQGLAGPSIYRIVFAITLSGFILVNAIFILIYLVSKLTQKTIGTKCKYMVTSKNLFDINRLQNSDYPSCGQGYCMKQRASVSIFCRVAHKYSYVFVLNLILIYILCIDFSLWFYQKSFDCNPEIDVVVTSGIVVLPFVLCAIVFIFQRKLSIATQNLRLIKRSQVEVLVKLIAQGFDRNNNIIKKAKHDGKEVADQVLQSQERLRSISWIEHQQDNKRWKILKSNLSKKKK